jgi:hypothetical protein
MPIAGHRKRGCLRAHKRATGISAGQQRIPDMAQLPRMCFSGLHRCRRSSRGRGIHQINSRVGNSYFGR